MSIFSKTVESQNMQSLVDFFADRAVAYPHLQAVNLGGGIPHAYREDGDEINLAAFAEILQQAQQRLSALLGRPIRVEVEPGRYVIAPSACVVTRVTDIKHTATNNKGPEHTFVMVDAGFTDLVRPAMYGSYHQLSVWRAPADAPRTPVVVAGPLCESGDVFTRDSEEFLQPRALPPVHGGGFDAHSRCWGVRCGYEFELQFFGPRPSSVGGGWSAVSHGAAGNV